MPVKVVARSVAEHVHHDRVGEQARRRERKLADRAHVLFVLRAGRDVDRVVAAVVRTRRDLVEQQLVRRSRERTRRNTFRRCRRPRPTAAAISRAACGRSLHRRAPARRVIGENSAVVRVLGDRIGDDLVARVARRDDAELARERNERFEDQLRAIRPRRALRAPPRASRRATGPFRRIRRAPS